MSECGIRQGLELALREAMKTRDAAAAAALRSALAAIGNAGAVPAGNARGTVATSPHVAGSAAGLGAGEAERRVLTEADVERIVRAEISEREVAAAGYDRAGHHARAGRLRREAAVLASCIGPAGVPHAAPGSGAPVARDQDAGVAD